MEKNRTGTEEMAFRTAELDSAMQEAGFLLAYSDPEASRDFGYRARYIRARSTLFPLLNATLEYYLASKAFSLKISPSGDGDARTFSFLAKGHRGSLKELLEQYFASVRRGVPFDPGREKGA